MKLVLSEILFFLKMHWIHIIVGVPMIVGWREARAKLNKKVGGLAKF